MELCIKITSSSTAWTRQGCRYFPKKLKESPQNPRCQKGNIKFHTVYPQILGAIIQNLVAQITWHSWFVQPWTKVSMRSQGWTKHFQ